MTYNKLLQYRETAENVKKVQKAAKQAGMTVSEFIRMIIRKKVDSKRGNIGKDEKRFRD